MTKVLEIACDEGGYTGPDLLNRDQRYFTYASVNLSDEEASEVIIKARAKHKIQMPEIKASRLMKSPSGRFFISDVFNSIEGQYAVTVSDKLLALTSWMFEYIYEPVYQKNPRIFYDKDFHRHIAMFSYLWFDRASGDAVEAVRQFQTYMRSRDAKKAPIFFDRDWPPLGEDMSNEDPFDLILRFSYGYRDIIRTDNARLNTELPEKGRWTLDLSASGIWNHLNHWGKSGNSLRVNCDASKPIKSIINNFTGDKNDPAIQRMKRTNPNLSLGYSLDREVKFVDSSSHPAVQLADLVASTTASILSFGMPNGFEATSGSIDRHALKDNSIMPDLEIIDLEQRAPMINYVVMYELAKRAEEKADPYFGIEELYRLAEMAWARGDFRSEN